MATPEEHSSISENGEGDKDKGEDMEDGGWGVYGGEEADGKSAVSGKIGIIVYSMYTACSRYIVSFFVKWLTKDTP